MSFLAKPTFRTSKSRGRPTLSSFPIRKVSRRSGNSLCSCLSSNTTLLLVFLLSLAFYPALALQNSESRTASSSTFNATSLPDFTITATPPNIVPADGTTLATSTIIVNPLYDFTGSVALSDLPLPAGIMCTSVEPSAIPKGLGMATLSCYSSVAGTYAVVITGVSGGITHTATATFTFGAFEFPDFMISATSPVSLTSGSTANLSITVIPKAGFDSEVNLTATVYPSTGLSVSLGPWNFVLGSRLSTAVFSSSTPGDYIITITGTSKSLSHTIPVTVVVSPAGLPDFEISAGSGSINIASASSGAVRIIITPNNGFTDSVRIVVLAPIGVSCSLSPTVIQSSGASTLTCTSNTIGDYTITIMATGGTNSHSTIVNVHVAAVSPTAPVPSMILGLAPAVFYGTIVVIILGTFAGTVLALRSRYSKL